ncbi:MAG: MarR family transcriptional regulator [Microbacterium sp.]
MVCFSLYAASRATTQTYRRLLAPWGLTYPQYLVLVELWDLGPRTVRELGDDLALDSGTLSPLLRRMADAGLVVRSRDRSDGRVVSVRLTDRGEGLREELAGVPQEFGRCLGLTLDDARQLLDVLRRLTGTAQASNLTDAAPLAASA